MDCREFEGRFEDLLEERLSTTARATCEAHAAGCAGCGELLAAALSAAGASGPPAATLLAGVLERTVGSACDGAREILCAHLDGELGGVQEELVEAHLDGCEECRGLATALAALSRDLPSLAEARPGEPFVAAVLAATLPPSVRLRRWWRATWPRWVHRPRFATEAGFVGMLVLVLLFGVPREPLAAVPVETLERAQVAARVSLTHTVETVEVRVDATLAELKEADGVRKLEESKRAAALRLREARTLWQRGRERLGTWWEAAASLVGNGGGGAPAPQTDDSIEEKS